MKNRFISLFLTIFFLCSLNILAQTIDPKKEFKGGVGAYKRHDYNTAMERFKNVVNYNSSHQHGWYYLGMSYKKMEDYDQAIYAFSKLQKINPNYNPAFYFELGNAYIAVNSFDKAALAYNNFLAKYPDKPKNAMNIHEARNRLEYAQKSPEIRNMPNSTSDPIPLAQINSISNDYTPQVNPMGTRLYFTSTREGGFDSVKDSSRANDFGEDIYFSELKNEQWSQPSLLPPPINSKRADFGSAFTGDSQTMVYVRCGGKRGIGSCDLYMTYLDGSEWSEPANMGNVVNSRAWDSQPTISADGTRIIFSSARKGGYGATDLFMTEKNHLGLWGIPQNLGSTINTPLSDNSPYLAPDGKTLYYASSGHPGYGGLDIFYSVFENGKWSIPVNIGAPLNSKGDDKHFSTSATGKAYFASSRMGENNIDIFEIELPDHLKPKPTAVIQGIVSNAESSEPLGTVVMIEDIDTGELIAINKSNAKSGEYLVVLPAGRNYSVSASKDGYFFYSQSFDLPKDTSYQEITKNIALEPITKGTKVILNNIFFESGRAELKPISYVELNKAVKLMEDNPTMIIEVGGHTDNVGSEALNLKLSQGRAAAVVDYIKLAGIEGLRLQAKGYGETIPIDTNDTKEGRLANRRTEFVIVEF